MRYDKKRPTKQSIPNQPYYRKRKQEFYWNNHLTYGYEWELDINLVACLERREVVNKKSGAVEIKYSEHAWSAPRGANRDCGFITAALAAERAALKVLLDTSGIES